MFIKEIGNTLHFDWLKIWQAHALEHTVQQISEKPRRLALLHTYDLQFF